MGLWAQRFFRRKQLDAAPTNLARKLGVLDLTALGVGATLGAGVYVLTGVVAKTEAGPAIIISFLISGLASVMSGLCYAEFGARVPRAGSAYVYSYVTVGELLAWTTGWQLLLEYIIGASSVARSWSGYLDSLSNGAISGYFTRTLGTWNVPGLAADPDFLAAGATLLLSGIVSVGVKESTTVNNILTTINLAVILFVIIAGAFYVDKANYSNFAPNGFNGIFKGAATSFYAYVGFDVIATSAEETINPARVIPLSIISSLLICAAAYMGVSGIVTAMVRYDQLDDTAPLAAAFGVHGATWARYIISVGAVSGLSTSLMTCIFPMPRIIYAISSDGLLPAWVGRVSPRFNTPVVATMLCGGFAAGMALIFDINALADMMSIGTLISYTLVAASVLVLRYRTVDPSELLPTAADTAAAAEPSKASDASTASAASAHSKGSGSGAPSSSSRQRTAPGNGVTPLLADDRLSTCLPDGGESRSDDAGPTADYRFRGRTAFATACITVTLFTVMVAVASTMSAVMTNYDDISEGALAVMYTVVALSLLGAAGCVALLLYLPRNTPRHLAFRTPGMPWVPLASIGVNVYLLVSLSPLTWVRFAIWCVIGGLIYGFYGAKHSVTPLEEPGDSSAMARARDSNAGLSLGELAEEQEVVSESHSLLRK